MNKPLTPLNITWSETIPSNKWATIYYNPDQVVDQVDTAPVIRHIAALTEQDAMDLAVSLLNKIKGKR